MANVCLEQHSQIKTSSSFQLAWISQTSPEPAVLDLPIRVLKKKKLSQENTETTRRSEP